MIVDLPTVYALQRMYSRINIPKEQIDLMGRVTLINRIRGDALDALNDKARELGDGVELHAADLVFGPPTVSEDQLTESWVIRWEPVPDVVTFLGGPKDGLVMHAPGLRDEIRLASVSRAALADAYRGDVLPMSTLVYRLGGYDLAARTYVYRFAPLLSN